MTVRTRLAATTAAVLALAGGIGLAAQIASAGATAPVIVTLGSTTGTPSQNLCVASIVCTYLPFAGVANPELQVPFDGTVTSFSVHAASAGNTVSLRVLHPARGGGFTGVGSSPPETLAAAITTFTVSMPVKAGDLLGLDNADSALVFDSTDPNPITAYYELPSLADGQTAAPNHNVSGYRLLLSATVEASGSASTTTTTTTTIAPPVVTNLRQSHRAWLEGSKLAKFSRKRTLPVGTTFSFALNHAARVRFGFAQQLTGRRVSGRCVAQNSANRGHPACRRAALRGRLLLTGHAGINRAVFQGRISRSAKLAVGTYTLVVSAANGAGASQPRTLTFTIARS